jgi:hypothetical protein
MTVGRAVAGLVVALAMAAPWVSGPAREREIRGVIGGMCLRWA